MKEREELVGNGKRNSVGRMKEFEVFQPSSRPKGRRCQRKIK
jgi:hypothetical protein